MNHDELESIMVNMGLLPAGLAEILGVTRGAVMHWLDGRRSVPEVVARVVRMLHEDPADVDYFTSFKSE